MLKKKILFLIPSLRGGGAEKVTLLLGNELIKLGWEIGFLMAQVEGPFLEHLDPKIKIIKLPYRKISRNILAIRAVLQSEKPDIFYTIMEYVNIIGGIAHKLSNSKAKLVYSEHNNIYKTLETHSTGMRFFLKVGIKYAYNLPDRIVCVSEGVRDVLQEYLPNLKNVSVLYNPIEQMHPNTDPPTNDSIYRILSIGRLNRQKNHILLLKAFKYLQETFSIDAHLTIIGEGKERKVLNQYIIQHNLIDKVDLPGFKDSNTYLHNSDLFVLSSEYEGFGNVLVEALSTGIPVISTDCPSGPAEILKNGLYGQLVPVHDEIALAKAIYKEYLTEDNSEKRMQRIQRANDFAVEKIAAQYEALFHTLLK